MLVSRSKITTQQQSLPAIYLPAIRPSLLLINGSGRFPRVNVALSNRDPALFPKHVRNDHAARLVQIYVIAIDHRGRCREYRVNVVHHLQPLEQVGPHEPHALADQLKKIDNLEWPIAFMRTEFAVARVI